MINPIKLCRPIYKDGICYYQIGDKLLGPEEIVVQKSLDYFGLTKDDCELSENKLVKIIEEEKLLAIEENRRNGNIG
jgi:hypothetical protein